MRLSRSCPAVPLGEIAACAKLAEQQLRSALRHLGSRGGCARMVVDAALDRRCHWTRRAAALQNPACPPVVARLVAGTDWVLDPAVSAVGIAGWGARGAGAVSPPPSAIRGDPMDRLDRNGREMPLLMLVSLSDSPDGRTRRLVASRAGLSRRGSSRPGLPPEFLARFAYDPDADVRGEVASWVSASLAACLAADEDWGVRSCVAANPLCSPETLASLARDEFGSVRSEVAKHDACPLEALAMLANDTEHEIRKYVAANPLCSPETLASLARDEFESVRVEVAKHDACPLEALAMLTNDTEHKVREHVAAHPNTPPQTLLMLAGSPEGPTVQAGSKLAAIREDKRRDLRR